MSDFFFSVLRIFENRLTEAHKPYIDTIGFSVRTFWCTRRVRAHRLRVRVRVAVSGSGSGSVRPVNVNSLKSLICWFRAKVCFT